MNIIGHLIYKILFKYIFQKLTSVFGKLTSVFGKLTLVFGKLTLVFGKLTLVFGKLKIKVNLKTIFYYFFLQFLFFHTKFCVCWHEKYNQRSENG
jgi:hypothetical protein